MVKKKIKRKRINVWTIGKNGKRVLMRFFYSNKRRNEYLKQIKKIGFIYNRHYRGWILKKKRKEKIKRIEKAKPVMEKYTEISLPISTILALGSHKYRELENSEFYVRGQFSIEDVWRIVKDYQGKNKLIIDGNYVDVKDLEIRVVDSLRGDERIYDSIYDGLEASFSEIKTWTAKYPDWKERRENGK
ncbi:MAG: hypothetical protein QW478_14210 [Candidatus Micrarchaeaceae archaeon]